MANTLTVTLTQPVPSVDWNLHIDSLDDYIKNTYIDPGQILDRQINISDDLLTYRAVTTFRDSDTIDTFLQDPVISSNVYDRNELVYAAGGSVSIVIS